MATAEITGISHVALNVRDLDASVRWYGEVLGFAPLFPYDTDSFRRRILVHPCGAVVALSTHDDPASQAGFDERRTGLDHLSFAVSAQEDLDAWASRLDEAGVAHSGVTVNRDTGSALVAFRDPDGIQLELYVQVGMPG